MDRILSRCGMRCDLCLLYRPNVEADDRRAEICRVFGKVFPGFVPDPQTVICDGCTSRDAGAVLFDPDCRTRRCVNDRGLRHCGCCERYPCDIFPAEPTQEELVRLIDVEKRWSWVIADLFGGDAGDAFSAICCLQKSRFTSSKPSISAIASVEKFIRHRTTSLIIAYLGGGAAHGCLRLPEEHG